MGWFEWREELGYKRWVELLIISSNSCSIKLAASSGCSISCTVVLQIPQALHQGSPRQAGFPQKVWNSSVMSSLFALNNLNILLQKSSAWKQ